MIQDNSTEIALAEVRSRVDPNRTGRFRAKISSEGNSTQEVYYVSPYGSNTQGAFVAIPEVGTQILVCKPKGSSDWYYLGTTFSPEPKEAVGDTVPDSQSPPLERVDPLIHQARGKPMRYLFKTPEGAGITMVDEYNPKFFNGKVHISSARKKEVVLHDAPAIDSIRLDTGNGSKITLTDDPQNQSMAARSIQVESVGPQKYICSESQTDVVVGQGGRELQLLNNANGVQWGDGADCGNVNIQSKWKDVNVFTQAESGRIFIECLNENGSNQTIQIETNGEGGAIVIKTKGDIRLDAGGNIDMKAGGQIRMKSGSTYSVDSGGSLEMQAASTANIEAPTVSLADGASPSAPNTQGQQSTYGNIGITTY